MIYDKYKSRMEYLAKLWSKIKRFKFLIMSIVLAITAIVSGLVAAKGTISWETEPLSEITYGESLSMQATAFLSDVSYEYKAEGEQVWKSQTPNSAGNYSVRAVADAAFGKKRYTDAKQFTILPVTLLATIKEDSIVYGQMPTLVCDDLVGKDTIACVAVSYGGLNTQTESIESATVCITNAQGVDVTGCYTITVESKELDVTARAITIDTPSASKVYDGKSLSATEYTVSTESGLGLVSGDTITSTLTAEIVNVGSVQNAMDLTVINADEMDVSAYYNPTYGVGTLTVTARPITIESESNTPVVYDGTEHKHERYIQPVSGEDSGLVSGHVITPTFTGAITNAGTVDNTFTVVISDGNGPVTSNYDIDYDYGVLTVDKRPITVTSEGYSWTYDGTEKRYERYDITRGTLVSGQRETVSFTGGVKNAISVDNTFTVEIFQGTTPVTSNYEITPVCGTLTVEKASLTLLTNSDSKAYDGTPLYNTGYSFESGQLFGGQTLVFTDKTEVTFVEETGDNVLTVYEIKQNGSVYDGDFLLNDNYTVTVRYGTLTITKRAVVVTASSDVKTYDGAPFNKNEFTSANLPDNHTLSATVATQNAQKHVGTYTNVASGASVTATAHGDVTGQFTFSYTDGTLTINPRQVRLTVSDVKKMYNGTAQEVEEQDVSPIWDSAYNQPVDGDTPQYTLVSDCLTDVSVGAYQVHVTFNDGNDGNNYQVIGASATATFSIIPRPIKVLMHSHTWTYDGAWHSCLYQCGYNQDDLYVDDVEFFSLVNGHTLRLDYATPVLTVGSMQNSIALQVIDGNDGNNYEITYAVNDSGSMLTITHREITIHTHDHAFVYNGQAQNCGGCGESGYEVEPTTATTGLVSGQDLLVGFNKYVTNVGDEAINDFVILITDNGTDITGNYVLSENCTRGTLTVTPRPITVQAHNHTFTYNGEEQGCTRYDLLDVVEGSLVFSTHTLEILTATTAKDVGTYSNQITVRVNDGNDGKNYLVTCLDGELTILPRKVYVQLDDISKIYNGEEQSATLDDIETHMQWQEWGDYLLPVDDYELAVDCQGLIDVGEVYYTLSVVFSDGNGGNNYEIYPQPLTARFIVNPRPIIIQTHDHEWTYDGDEHSCFTNGCVYRYDDLSEYSEYDLLDEHTLSITYSPTVTNVWDTVYGNNTLTLTVQDGNDGKNYDVQYAYGTLTINARPVTVTTHDHEFIYNGQPQNCYEYGCGDSAYDLENATQDTGLVSGHRMELFLWDCVVNVGDTQDNYAYAYFYSDTNENVTENYTFSNACSWGTLTVTHREITIHTHDHEFIYNGQPQNCMDCGKLAYDVEPLTQDTGLVDDQYLTVLFSNSVTNVGDEEYNEFTIRITSDGQDVSYNYKLSETCSYGKLTVAQRAVYFELDVVKKVYNGQTQYPVEEDITYSLLDDTGYYALVDGHVVRFFDIECDGVKNVGTADFAFRIVIASGNDDVTANYDIQPDNLTGVIEITPRRITVTTDEVVRTYNGNDQTPTAEELNLRCENLIDGHELSIEEASLPTMRNAGTEEFAISIVIYEGVNINDADITYNYIVNDGEPVIVTFTIERRLITIQSHDHEWTYDGNLHDCNGETDAYTIEPATEYTGRVATHGLGLSFTGVIKDVVDGGVQNTFTFVVLDENGEPVTENYQLVENEDTYGTLTITPRVVKVDATHSHEFTYNGQPQSCKTCNESYFVTVDEENGYYSLLDGHELVVATATEVINVSDCGENGIQNALTFSVDDGNDGKNYRVVTDGIQNGTLTMKKAVVTVYETCTHSWTYDGKAHGCLMENGCPINAVGLNLGHTLYVISSTMVTEVCDNVRNEVQYGVLAANGRDISMNYDIDVVSYGTLKINALELTIRASSYTEIYDGRYPFAEMVGGYEILSEPLSNGYEILVTGEVDNDTIVNAGESTIHRITSVIVLYDGEDVTGNFVIDYSETGIFDIEKRYLEVIATSEEHVFTGEWFTIYENSYDYFNLADGHFLTAETLGVSERYVGEYLHEIVDGSAIIVDENGVPVTENYDIFYGNGTLRITRCVITITTGSDTKEYDGEPLTNQTYEVITSGENGGLAYGHKVLITEFRGSQTDVGTSYNAFNYEIIDTLNGDEDVTLQYTVIEEAGELIVTPRLLTFTTGSAEKPFDGTPLTCDVWQHVAGTLVGGHRLEAVTTGSQIEPGRSYNGLYFIVYDQDEMDVSYNYDFSNDCVFGILTVYDDEPKVLFYVTTNRDGDLYLREMSYGDYDASTGVWGTANAYTNTAVSPLYYAGLAVQSYGISKSTVTVEAAEGYAGLLPYMLPYYVTDSDGVAYGDLYASYAWTDAYTLDYYAYVGRSATYADEDANYVNYVNEYYTQLPTSTKNYMLSIIAQQGWSATDEDIIDLVAAYIRNAATYNRDYDRRLERSGDIAVSFLRDYKEGVCRHYASAATAMFRALGIPARYTEGFYVSAEAYQRVGVKEGHAWVEVYIEGMGWVNVEVTGSAVYKQTLTIKPEDFIGAYPMVTEYDASLRDSDTGIVDAKDHVLETLLAKGYEYEAVVSGAQYGPGEAEIEIISFVLYNADFEVVTDDFEIIYEKGVIVISQRIVTLSGGSWKYYDGTALDYNTQSWMATIDIDGVRYQNGEVLTVSLDFESMPTLINAGKLTSDDLRKYVKIVDQNGDDVTDDYYIDTTNLVFEVRKMALNIKISNASKPYDGVVLQSTAYSLRSGKLVEGHTLTIETTGSSSAEVGTYKNELISFTVKDLSGNDVTANYEIIDYTVGKLTITE